MICMKMTKNISDPSKIARAQGANRSKSAILVNQRSCRKQAKKTSKSACPGCKPSNRPPRHAQRNRAPADLDSQLQRPDGQSARGAGIL